MEATAAFVFSSGGVVRVDELSGFFQRRPEVFVAVLTEAELTRSLKKIVDKFGTQHGLFWRDDDPQSTGERGSVVMHAMTAEQRERGVFDSEVQWVPRALVAVERHVRALPGLLMKTGAISDFYNAYPLESEFMKRRCHSIVDFVQHYDPQQQRIGWDSRGSLYVQRVGNEEREGQEKVKEDSVTPLAQLECAVQAEFVGLYSHTDEGTLSADPLPEAEDFDDRADRQVVRGSWSRCSQEISILPEPTDKCNENELRLVALTAHPSADNGNGNRDSECDESRAFAARAVAAVASVNRPIRGCEFSPDILRMLESLDRVCLLLVQARYIPKSHPIALLVVAHELRERERRMRKLIRRTAVQFTKEVVASALALSSQVKLKSQEASSLVRVTPPLMSNEETTRALSVVVGHSASAELFTCGEWTFEMTLSTLVQLNRILLHARTTPALHPLVLQIVAFERQKQKQRSERKARKSQTLAKFTPFGGLNIVIPKATLELLSCCLSAAPPTMVVIK